MNYGIIEISTAQALKNVKAYVAEVGENPCFKRQATAAELAEFENLKPLPKEDQIVSYINAMQAKSMSSFYQRCRTGRGQTRPESSIEVLRKRGMIFAEN